MILAFLEALRIAKTLVFSVVFVEIPYSTERGILKNEQGTIWAGTGNFLRTTGKPPSGSFDSQPKGDQRQEPFTLYR